MANESYDEFADTLQREYEADGIRFCILEVANFANIRVKDNEDSWHYLGTEMAKKIIDYLEEKGYVDKRGNVQDTLKNDIQQDIFNVSEELKPYKEQIEEICLCASGKLPIRDKRERREVQLNKVVYLSPEFKELWDRVKWKTDCVINFV